MLAAGQPREKKILLVSSDEDLIRNSLSRVLHDDRTEVLCAMNGHEAFREFRNRAFDLCFLDLHLPDLNGLDLLWTLRQLSPATRVVIMTGVDVDDATMNAIREHAVLRLVKPFDLFRVKALAEEIIEKNIDGYRDCDTLASRFAGEKRLHERKPVATPVNYTVLVYEDRDDRRRHIADAIDISTKGLGIRTDVPLAPGRIVRLKGSNESIRGIVRWVLPEGRRVRYRAGIQLI